MQAFDLLHPSRVVHGPGRRTEIGTLARSLGTRAFLVHGSRTLAKLGVLEELAERLSATDVEVIATVEARGEPTIGAVDRAAEELFEFNPGPGDLVIALGGGAALDLGKAVAAMSVIQDHVSVRDYLEGVGRGLSLPQAPLPILAIPTTGGTGSEATRNAVISCADPPCKKSLRHDGLMPRVVLIDPELAVHAPASVTAHSGMDAITQLLESYVTPRANAITRRLSTHGLQLALPALPIAFADGKNVAARSEMALAALLSGIALANSGLGMAHGVAAALGALHGAPHGLACAVMLPIALRTNLPACAAQLDELAADLGFGDAVGLVAAVVALGRKLGIPEKLSSLGVERSHLTALVAASRGNSMSANPRSLSDEELQAVLEENL